MPLPSFIHFIITIMLFDIIKLPKNATASEIEWNEMLKRIERRNEAWRANFDKELILIKC